MQPGQEKPIEQSQDAVRAYSFGRFRLDLYKQTLFDGDTALTLRPKSFEVLQHLVENAGRVVGREELLDAVWPDLVVTMDSVTQCLIEIRRVLGDSDKLLIQTLPRRGYLFDAEVAVEGEVSETPTPATMTPAGKGRSSTWTRTALLILALAILATWWRVEIAQNSTSEETADWRPEPASIAVLAFTDMSKDGDHQYLAEGISEEILNLLAQSRNLNVIARTSSFSFRDSNTDIATIARQLNVAHILEGSVRQSGNRVRVTAQLVEGIDGVHIWSETFDDDLSDIFALQDRVAAAVAGVLEVKLLKQGEERGSRTHSPNPLAWENYMRGKLFYDRRGDGDIMRAQSSFEDALEIDPDFADAWVSLSATIRQRLSGNDVATANRLTPQVARPMIRDALERALALDPDHPEALIRLAYYYRNSDKGHGITLNMIGRAAELGRNHTLVQGILGGTALQSGHLETAIPFIYRATSLDPLSLSFQLALGETLFYYGNFERAKSVFLSARELHPVESEDYLQHLAWVSICMGEYDQAGEYVSALSDGPTREMTSAILYSALGQNDLTDRATQNLLAFPQEEAADELARVYAMQGNPDEAFRWLSIATDFIEYSPRGRMIRSAVPRLQYSPFLRPLHEDERWQAWLSRANNLHIDDLDREVIALIRRHLEAHPDYYEPASSFLPGPT